MVLDDVCIDVTDYVRTALPEGVWRSARRVFVDGNLFGQQRLMSHIPNIFSAVEIERPHPNLQERFFAVGDDALITDVIGRTRLIHNLLLLRLLGIERERVNVIAQASDFAREYTYALKHLVPNGPIQQAVFSFASEQIASSVFELSGRNWEVARCSGSLLKAILLQSEDCRTLLVHLTSVYGAQIVPFVDVLRNSFGLEELLLFGACGALAGSIGLHDTVFVRSVLDEDGCVLVEGNELLRLAAHYRAGLTGHYRSHVADVASVECIPGETRAALERLAGAGASVVDLELGPLARFLRATPGLRWGAALHVSDCPLMPLERLGTIRLLADASEARRVETCNQAAIVAGRHPRTAHSAWSEPRLSWQKAAQAGPFAVWETVLPSREGKAITVHAAMLPLDKLTLIPAVNPVGQGHIWEDEIVRGMLPWNREHMNQMNALFRKSPRQYLDEAACAAGIVAVLNGNGNLFWNLGHFVYLRPALYHHVRECLCGRQTVLLQDAAGLRLAVIKADHLAADVEFAVSGLRILRRGKPVDLLATDPDTGRPAVHDFYGDLTHVLHGFSLCLSLSHRLFAATSQVLHRNEQACYAKGDTLSPLLEEAVCGYPITCPLAPDDDITAVRATLARFGYTERRWREHLAPGSFALHSDGFLALAYRRATLGHSVIASTENPGLLLLVNTYTDPDRKGFTLEDTARVVCRTAASLGHRVQDALVLASSGDPRIVLRHGADLICLEKNRSGETLLFKGGLDYGLSSTLMVVAKP